MSDTSTASNLGRRLRELIDDLLSRARRASCETESLARLVVEIHYLDAGKGQSAAAYLKQLGYVGDALRLQEDVGHLQRKSCEVFQRSISPDTEPHDSDQAQRDLESLHAEVSRLVVFLRELESFCVNENASPTGPAADAGTPTAPAAVGSGDPAAGDDNEPVDAADGPIKPDGFCWKGKTHSGLARKPFLVLEYLWGCAGRAARPDCDMAEAVYGDHEEDFPDSAVRGLRQEMNSFFRAKGLPFHAQVLNGCLRIGDGSPQPDRRKPAKTKRPNAKARGKRAK